MTPVDAFAALVAAPDLDERLDEAALAVAAVRPVGADRAAAAAELDRLADRCVERSIAGVLDALRAAGFSGNRAAYYEPANSYLDQVLSRRTGIPITLAIVAIAVGRRVGVPIVGVGMPSHFLIGSPDGERFADPFNGVDHLDAEACRRLFESVIAPGLRFDAAYLLATPPLGIIRRLLHNLIAIFDRTGARQDLVWATELLTLLPDATPSDRRGHATALAAAGRFDVAAALLEELADSEPGDHARVVELRARLN